MKFQSRGALSTAFEEDLKDILKTPPEVVRTISNAYLEHIENLAQKEKPVRSINVDIIEENIKETKVEHETFVAISRLILFSAQTFTPKDKDDFDIKLSKLNLKNEEKEDFLRKLEIIKESGLMKVLYYNQELEKIVSFGIKRFNSITFMTDFRILDPNDENRILTPVVIARLTFTDDNDFEDSLIFQLSSSDLDELSHSIDEFKSKFNREREVINDMTYKG